MADRITFDDKADLVTSAAARINKSTAADWNDIKTVVNSHADNLESLESTSPSWAGWASYVDTQYETDDAPYIMLSNANYRLPNNSGTVIDSQKPTDINSFVEVVNLGSYDYSKILGRSGDSIDIMIYFKAKPTSNNDAWLDIWLDIGGSVGEIYRQTFTFPKGSGVERGILYAIPSAYNLSTWEANGATVYFRSNDILRIYDINMNIDRNFKARP